MDPGRTDEQRRYRCYGCLRYLRIPTGGHRVGLVPTHKRTPEERARAADEMKNGDALKDIVALVAFVATETT